MKQGIGYEVYVNSSQPVPINWSMVGIVYNKTIIELNKNSTDFGINWIAVYGNTTLRGASDLLTNISNSDAVSNWNSQAQTSQGLVPNPLPIGPAFLGTNFSIVMEKGYEISVTQNYNWTQI